MSCSTSGYVPAVLNVVLLGALLVCFAAFATTHVVIVFRLLLTARPRYRALLAIVVPPLAPMWAYRAHWRRLCWTWIGAVVGYAVMLGVASLVS